MILLDTPSILVINKPPGLAVHDAPGPGGSLLRTLREQGFADLTPIHRLDKDASGVLVFARNAETAARWTARWTDAQKTYLALCDGAPHNDDGTIDAPILENQTSKPERLQRAVAYFKKTHSGLPVPPLPPPKTSAVHVAGRESQTEYDVRNRFTIEGRDWSCIEVRPKQGRMHQIRVHLKHIACPLAVDSLYGSRSELKESDVFRKGTERVLLARMPLHAAKLFLPTTVTDPEFSIEAPLPEDLQRVLAYLDQHAKSASRG
jgi:23S rRNA pseudouridine1911/1915/1917 synthase